MKRHRSRHLGTDFDDYRVSALYADVPLDSRVVELCRVAHSVEYFRRIPLSIQHYLGDLLDTGYPSFAWDAVLSADTIGYIEEPEQLIAEMARITKPDGFFRITTMLSSHTPDDSLWEFEPADLLTMFTNHALGNVSARVDVVGSYLVATGWR